MLIFLLALLVIGSLFTALTHVNSATSNMVRIYDHKGLYWSTYLVECGAYIGGALWLSRNGHLSSPVGWLYALLGMMHLGPYLLMWLFVPAIQRNIHDVYSERHRRYHDLHSSFVPLWGVVEAFSHLWLTTLVAPRLQAVSPILVPVIMAVTLLAFVYYRERGLAPIELGRPHPEASVSR